MTFPFGEPITLVVRVPGPPDSYGDGTWTTTRTTVTGAFNPGTSVESLGGRDLLTAQPAVYLPAGTNLSAIDAVEVRGLTYEVDGDPIDWLNPLTGWRPGVEVRLRRAAVV